MHDDQYSAAVQDQLVNELNQFKRSAKPLNLNKCEAKNRPAYHETLTSFCYKQEFRQISLVLSLKES